MCIGLATKPPGRHHWQYLPNITVDPFNFSPFFQEQPSKRHGAFVLLCFKITATSLNFRFNSVGSYVRLY
jgi:hypothetical protein